MPWRTVSHNQMVLHHIGSPFKIVGTCQIFHFWVTLHNTQKPGVEAVEAQMPILRLHVIVQHTWARIGFRELIDTADFVLLISVDLSIDSSMAFSFDTCSENHPKRFEYHVPLTS